MKSYDEYLFQFAADPRHLATSFEVIGRGTRSRSETKFFWWGNSTKFIQKNTLGLAAPNFKVPALIKKLAHETEHQNRDLKISVTSGGFVASRILLGEKLRDLESRILNLSTVDELMSLKFNELEIGSTLANALVSYTKERYPNLKKSQKILKIFMRDYASIINSVDILLRDKNKEEIKIYLFNGRFLHEKAILDYCKAFNIYHEIYEVIQDRFLVEAGGFHDRQVLQARALMHWEKSTHTDTEKQDISEGYFNELKSTSSPFYPTKTLTFDKLGQKNYFIYYTSSDDEYVGWWGSQTLPLGSQYEVVKKLQEIFDETKKTKLLVKIHPNIANKGKIERARWDQIQDTEFSHVERGRTYDPLFDAIGVLSFGSTAGLEASYWGIPSAVLAPCSYDQLDAAWSLNSWNDVREWIQNDRMRNSKLDKHRVGAMKRAYYIQTAGIHYQYTQLSKYAAGAFRLSKFGRITIQYKEIPIFRKIFFVFKRVSKGLSFR